jgi:hypothetical protein
MNATIIAISIFLRSGNSSLIDSIVVDVIPLYKILFLDIVSNLVFDGSFPNSCITDTTISPVITPETIANGPKAECMPVPKNVYINAGKNEV